MKKSRSVTIIITPFLVQSFEWLWVFVDETMFFGSISSQNNVSMDDLVSIFISITAACLFQLAQKDLAHLFNKAFVINKETQFLEKKESTPTVWFPSHSSGGIHCQSLLSCQHSVSLHVVMGLSQLHCQSLLSCQHSVSLHVVMGLSQLHNLRGSEAYTLTLCFLCLVGFLPEVIRCHTLIRLSWDMKEINFNHGQF